MKKCFLIFLLFLLNFSFSFASNQQKINPRIIEINLNVYKKKLEKEKNGSLYIKKLDEKISKMDKQTLEKYSKILEKYLKTYKGEYFNLLKYMKFKVNTDLLKGNFGEEVLKKENLEIYKNEKLGFEILKEKKSDIVDNGIGILFGKSKENQIDFIVLVIDYNTIENVNNLSDYVELFIKNNLKDGVNVDAKKLNINGLIGYKLSYEGRNLLNGSNYNEFYIFGNDKDKIFYNINFIDKDYKYKEKIINSFKIYYNVDKNLIISFQKEHENSYYIKSLDTKRILELNTISMPLESYFVDYGAYPEKLQDIPSDYFLDKKIPKNPKDGQIINGCKFGYTYEKISDIKYRLSTCLESESSKKAMKNDGGIYDNEYEIFN